MKKTVKKIEKIVVTIIIFTLLIAHSAFAEISEGSITGAAGQAIDGIFLIIGGAFVVLGAGSCLFAGYNLYTTFQEGGTGNSSNKAAGGFAAGIIAFIIGILALTLFKGIVKSGLGIG